MVSFTRSPDSLRKRLDRLLHDNTRKDGPELWGKVLPALSRTGRVALLGGAVRDVCRWGSDRFSSDLDFVIHEGDKAAFEEMLSRFEAVPNRFGGYRLNFVRWRVDVWMLEDTWARTAGLRVVDEIEDILDCTFFDWDAIIYLIDSSQIIHKANYFDRLETNVMDVNLELNPNPLGALVRSLRRAALWDVCFGERLTAFARRNLERFDWSDILALEARAFARPVLQGVRPERVAQALQQSFEVGNVLATDPLGGAKRQLHLPLQQPKKPITESSR